MWGVDLVEEHLLTSAGIPSRPPAAPAPLAHLACWLANADKTGHMRGFECLDEWRRHPDVCYARPLVEVCDMGPRRRGRGQGPAGAVSTCAARRRCHPHQGHKLAIPSPSHHASCRCEASALPHATHCWCLLPPLTPAALPPLAAPARPCQPGAKVTGPADGLPTWVCELMVVKPTAQEAIDFIVKGIEARMEWPIDPLPPKVAAPAKA